MAIDGGLRKIFHQKIDGHWQAIETGGVGLGVPDSNFCIDGVEGWIEFKKTDHWKPTLRPEQIAWIHRRWRQGGNVWIAVRRIEKELWLVRGDWVRELGATGLKAVEAIHWSEPWDWEAIRNILKSKAF